MDYKKETETLGQQDNIWKANVGQHKIMIMSEPEECVYKQPDGTENQQIKMQINVLGQEKTFYVSRGKTHDSLFGQLMLVGQHHNHLKGVELNLVVKSGVGKDGKPRKSYTVLEALPLMSE